MARQALAALACGALLATAGTAQASGSSGAELTIKKHLIGSADEVAFHFEGSEPIGSFTASAGGAGVRFSDLPAWVRYTIRESPMPGYEFLASESDCSGGDVPKAERWYVDDEGNGVLEVTIKGKGSSVVCSFANRRLPTVTIEKVVIGASDSPTPFGATLTSLTDDGPVVVGRYTGLSQAGGPQGPDGLEVGWLYSLEEDPPGATGYEHVSTVCSKEGVPTITDLDSPEANQFRAEAGGFIAA